MGKSQVLPRLEKEMGGDMIVKIADNIVSPLGLTTDENFDAVLTGKSMLSEHTDTFGLPEAFCGSLFNRDTLKKIIADELGNVDSLSFLEQICIYSASKAIQSCNLSVKEHNVIFVISTTKGNVEYLEGDRMDERCYLSSTANKIASFFGNPNTPIVVSNACISGVCAQITAIRELLGRHYKYAVVIGCDVLSKFIVSGFQSFKALSASPCQPYNKERAGLNLGEAVGTLILERTHHNKPNAWQYVASSIHNDANHISGPSRIGEGSFRVLSDILKTVDKSDLAFVNAHGTATEYNDEMESIAIHRAGLDNIPANGLKGVYGHTLGAAGVIETILSMKAVDRGVVLPTKGYAEQGTTYWLNLSPLTRQTDKKTFIKILSGFGGSNAGIAYQKGGEL